MRRPKPQKGKKKGHIKVNLKLAPFHINDGDEIGVKVGLLAMFDVFYFGFLGNDCRDWLVLSSQSFHPWL